MANIGTVNEIAGEVFAVNEQGVKRPLHKGDIIQTGDTIITPHGGFAHLALDTGRKLLIAEETVKLTQEFADSIPSGVAENSVDQGSIQVVIDAVNSGKDISTVLEDTAAGLGATSTSYGFSFVNLLRISEGVTPIDYAYEHNRVSIIDVGGDIIVTHPNLVAAIDAPIIHIDPPHVNPPPVDPPPPPPPPGDNGHDNNGWGNGDQNPPGNSGDNNNAENNHNGLPDPSHGGNAGGPSDPLPPIIPPVDPNTDQNPPGNNGDQTPPITPVSHDNNGFGNGDQNAPGNSGPNNNAENAQGNQPGNSANGQLHINDVIQNPNNEIEQALNSLPNSQQGQNNGNSENQGQAGHNTPLPPNDIHIDTIGFIVDQSISHGQPDIKPQHTD